MRDTSILPRIAGVLQIRWVEAIFKKWEWWKGIAMGCEHECINEHRLKELESAVHEMKEKHSKRDVVFFERINALEQKIALYNNDLGHIKDTVDEMNDNLKLLMEKPGKLQDKIIAYIITGIIGIVLGFALKGIFPV